MLLLLYTHLLAPSWFSAPPLLSLSPLAQRSAEADKFLKDVLSIADLKSYIYIMYYIVVYWVVAARCCAQRAGSDWADRGWDGGGRVSAKRARTDTPPDEPLLYIPIFGSINRFSMYVGTYMPKCRSSRQRQQLSPSHSAFLSAFSSLPLIICILLQIINLYM